MGLGAVALQFTDFMHCFFHVWKLHIRRSANIYNETVGSISVLSTFERRYQLVRSVRLQ